MDLGPLPAIDSHCHPIQKQPVPDYAAAFSEAHDPGEHARHSLFFRRSLKDMGKLLNCDPTETAVLAARAQRTPEQLFRTCVQRAGLTTLLLDDGLAPDRCYPIEWHSHAAVVHRLVRLEKLAEDLYQPGASFESWRDRYVAELESVGAVGFKSIAAYRTGLDIGEGEPALGRYAGGRLKLKPLNDYLVHLGMQVAQKRGLPVQFHTGFGDPDLALQSSNPLLLRPLIELYPRVPIVLLHAGYPYFREAGFLASVYSNVHLDFGLAVPFLSVDGMTQTVKGLLELAPISKITFSTDASRIPDLYFLGGLWGRLILKRVLEQTEDLEDKLEAARWILHDNAARLYLK